MAPAAGASSGTVPFACWRAGERIHAGRKRVDGRQPVESADLEVVSAHLAGSQVRKLAPLAGVEPPRVPVGGRLHGHSVRSLTEHPPHGVERELLFSVDLVRANSRAAVDHTHRYGPAGFGRNVMLVALLGESVVRLREPPVIASGVLGHR